MQGHLKSPVTGALCRLLAIVLAVGLAACSSDDAKPVARDACGTKAGTIESPTRLTYRGAGDVVDDVGILCERVDASELDARVLGAGSDRIVVEVADEDVDAAQAIVRTGALAFYDWEANVIGPSGRPAPDQVAVTGGPAAGNTGSLPLYEAVTRAAKRPANVEANNARRGSRFYAVDVEASKVFGSGSATRAGALAAVPAPERRHAMVREVKPGTVVLRAEASHGGDPDDAYFVLRDDVALRGSELLNPEQNVDQPGSGEPIVTFEFTPSGGTAFQQLTGALAVRGSRSARARPDTPSVDAAQHFAIVVDDQIVSVPYIDFRQNPDGISPTAGSQIQGGFTIASARRLATVLKSGALPVPLELVSTTTP